MKFSKYCEESLKDYILNIPSIDRKRKGQFFTPKDIALFMAKQYESPKDKKCIKILDPGGGLGILTAAVCDHLFSKINNIQITAEIFENDPKILPILKNNMNFIQKTISKESHNFRFKIIQKDFIMDKYLVLEKPLEKFDFIISNPPYYKLNKNSNQAILTRKIINGQPNIYFLFMAIASNLLKRDGQLTFIIPRSFCSGMYFERFRKWFLNNINITKIHLFGSRNEPFFNEVLQETLILTGKKNNKISKIKISHSRNSSFEDLREIEVNKDKVIDKRNGKYLIKIPTSKNEVNTINIFDSLPMTFSDLKLKISTGPFVYFRTRKYLNFKNERKLKFVPLLWMHNINNFKTLWPNPKSLKPKFVVLNDKTKKILIPDNTYILLKRFTSKEQKRRLSAGIFLKGSLKSNYIGIENHLNYIYRNKETELEKNLAFGLLALLNSSNYDLFFRTINGSTQVNAYDLDFFKFPDTEEIKKLGIEVSRYNELNYTIIDSLVEETLRKYK